MMKIALVRFLFYFLISAFCCSWFWWVCLTVCMMQWVRFYGRMLKRELY